MPLIYTFFRLDGLQCGLMGSPKRIGIFTFLSRCKKKCTLYSEGKTIISFDLPITNPVSGVTYQWADEIQLNLSKNSVHYIKIKTKGMNIFFEELSEKEGKKEFDKKKYKITPDYVEEASTNLSGTPVEQKRSKEPSKSKLPVNSEKKIEE